MEGGRRSCGLLLAATSVLAVALSGCGGNSKAKAWRSVHLGMSKSDVRSLLGKPTSFQSFSSSQAGITNTCWYYAAGYVGNYELDRYRVCFANGKVDEKHAF